MDAPAIPPGKGRRAQAGLPPGKEFFAFFRDILCGNIIPYGVYFKQHLIGCELVGIVPDNIKLPSGHRFCAALIRWNFRSADRAVIRYRDKRVEIVGGVHGANIALHHHVAKLSLHAPILATVKQPHMKLSPLFFLLLLFAACNDSEPGAAASEPAAAATQASDKTPAKSSDAPAQPVAGAAVDAPAIATIDMGNYIFRVHEILQYHPSEMQSRIMKMDDSIKDYYIVDCSIENKTNETFDAGVTAITAYFQLSDGSTFANVLRGGVILASYHVDNKKRYTQQQYDLMFSAQFPANGKSRADTYGVEVPEGVTITGVGFHRKNKAKNKFTEIAQ